MNNRNTVSRGTGVGSVRAPHVVPTGNGPCQSPPDGVYTTTIRGADPQPGFHLGAITGRVVETNDRLAKLVDDARSHNAQLLGNEEPVGERDDLDEPAGRVQYLERAVMRTEDLLVLLANELRRMQSV